MVEAKKGLWGGWGRGGGLAWMINANVHYLSPGRFYMMPIGPLPPSIPEKRKREDEADDNASDSDSSIGPAPPSPEETNVKKVRVIGPTLPPAPLEQKPLDSPGPQDDEDNASSSDDDFGPNLPPTGVTVNEKHTIKNEEVNKTSNISAVSTASKRDDWMTAPPPGGDWSSRIDPTKLKNRKFNTGRSANHPSEGGKADAWYETPAEKQERLQKELLGVKDKKTESKQPNVSKDDTHDAATAQRLEDYKKSRGPSLYQAHQQGQKVEEDDDPSARAFDREKDIGGGLQINSTQRRDMMKKASDFNSRFSSAKYL